MRADDEAAAARARLEALRPPPPRGWVPAVDAAEEPEPAWQPVAPSSPPGQSSAAEPPLPPQPPPAAPGLGAVLREWANDRLPPPVSAVVNRLGGGSLLTIALAIAALVLAGVVVLRHGGGSAGATGYDPAPAAAATFPSGTTPGDPTSIVVDVGGRVRKPGLVTLPEGARVADAIRAAGGALRHRDLRSTNLAARVSDGQLLLVGVTPAAASSPDTGSGGGDASAGAPVPLNSATLDQLETLPGIGPVTGQKIIDWRTAHGGFTSVGQLQDVSGIGPATYAEISPLVTL